MSKLKIFVFGYSVILLALFGTFSYLMSTVNPEKNPSEPEVTEPGIDIEEDAPVRFEYGLPKMENFRRNNPGIDLINGSTTVSKIVLFYRSLQKSGAFVDDVNIADVMPPTTTLVTRPNEIGQKSNATKP